MQIKHLLAVLSLVSLTSCSNSSIKITGIINQVVKMKTHQLFKKSLSIDIGEAGAAEITAFDPKTNRLFVVNNGGVNKIDVIDGNNPSALSVIASIDLTKYTGAVNSLDVHDGMLAAAIENGNKHNLVK